MSDRLKVTAQYLLPKQALTVLAGKLAGARAGGLTTSVIRWFVGRYGVNMAEAANPDIASYPSFNEFFTRPLKPGARSLARADYVCPSTGRSASSAASSATRSSRPRATATRPTRWSAATATWRCSSRTASSPPSTSARGTTTASTCPATVASRG